MKSATSPAECSARILTTEWTQALILALLLFAVGCGGNANTSNPNPLASCVPSSKPSFAYVLNANNTILSYTVNSCTGALTPTNPGSTATNGNDFGSESIAVDPYGRFAYVANLMSNAADLATISMYTINPSTGVLTPSTPPTVPTGYFPQGIAIDPSGKFVYTANSDDNTVSMFAINQTTGVLTPTTPPTVPTGSSPLSVTVDPTGKFAYVANQDDSTVSMYTINSSTGVLTPTTPAAVSANGFGVTVDPTGKFAYVPDDNQAVSEFAINSTTGILTPTAQGVVLAGSAPTSVAIDPSSKFAYVVNRQGNSVSAYSIDPDTGALSLIGTFATGEQPWRSTVDPSGKFLYVGNEGSSTVSIYAINGGGSLTSAGSTATGGSAFDLSVISLK